MRGQPPVPLPAAARARLQDLMLARGAAEDAARAAQGRLNNLPRDADQQLREKLTAERDKQNHRHGQLSQLTNRLQQWIAELRPGALLEAAPAETISLKNSETLSAAIATARSEIQTLRQQLQAARAAPLPREDQKQLAVAYVAQLARTARPTIGILRDQIKVTPRGDMHSPDDVLALIAWAAAEMVYTALEREIDAQPARAESPSAAERLRRTAELEATLDKFERAEEALIARAAGDGIDVLRRPDASPPAVLGVVVVREAKASAA